MDAFLRLPQDVDVTETTDGAVLLDQRNGRYWQLNHSGALVLRLLLDGHPAHDVARRLAERSLLQEGRAITDVYQLIGELRHAGLVIRA